MRRIAIVLSLLVVVALLHACAADAPTTPPPGNGGGGGGTSNALQIQLFTSDANPKAGACTLVEAVVTLNGNPVPDGTGVSFTTDFGIFSQNGLATVSVVTTNGTAVTALCGSAAGSAKVKATATVAGKTGSATVTIVFQPDQSALPSVTSCAPSVGSTNGGEAITLNGLRFFGSVSTTRVQFTAGGITRDGIVTSVGTNAITVTTPAFPELNAPNTPTQVTLTLGTNQSTPTVLSLPNCFSFGTTASNIPTITAILPSQGTKEGGTRVTIIGSGFSTQGVQVFFGTREATVVSTTFSQVIALSPKSFGAGEETVGVTVKNINSGTTSAPVNFKYTPAVTIVSANNTTQPAIGPFQPVTIFGQGFQAPVAVSLAGIPAGPIQSVSATEIVVLPGSPLVTSCIDISGPISVVNINTGDGVTGPDTLLFHYTVEKPSINGVSPGNSCDVLPTDPCPNGGLGGIPVQITGSGFAGNVEVKFGSQTAFQTGAHTSNTINVTAPITSSAPPTCAVGNPPGTHQVVSTVDVVVTNTGSTCAVTASQAFQYIMPCVAAGP